jgi:hypothetical protein
MTRNLKALGLALLAVFALGAIGAQAASAHEFKAGVQKSVITGKNVGVHNFQVGAAGTVSCAKAKFEGTVDAGTGKTEVDEITIKPTYEECTFGGQVAAVFFNDCAYVFDSDTTAGNSTGGEHAQVKVECAAGNKIQVHTVNCTITVGEQTIADAIRYEQDKVGEVPVTTATNTIATAHNIVTGKERSTAAQPVNGCLPFPTGAIGKYTGTATNECRQDEGSPQANTTTPGATQDAASTTCSVS